MNIAVDFCNNLLELVMKQFYENTWDIVVTPDRTIKPGFLSDSDDG